MYLPKNSKEARKQAVEMIEGLSYDKAWQLVAKPFKKQRANSQLRYYFGVVVNELCMETGNDKDTIHTHLLSECFGEEVNEINGKIYRRPVRSTTGMTVDMMAAYIEWCLAHLATEHGLIVPGPGEDV